MTSSLVGSEMCIRDRKEMHRIETRLTSSVAEPVVVAPEQAIGPAATVSYTHLTLPTICSV
eukprot:617086-Prorocentrum_lima.AAC.1